jgi:hypothetical protein
MASRVARLSDTLTCLRMTSLRRRIANGRLSIRLFIQPLFNFLALPLK